MMLRCSLTLDTVLCVLFMSIVEATCQLEERFSQRLPTTEDEFI